MYLTSSQPCTEPVRIISLVPSITELLADLGLKDNIAGITKFCVHPPDLLPTKQMIGGTKKINLPQAKHLHPTLIIANKEENLKAEVDELAADYPVWLTDISTLEDAYQMIQDIGILCGRHSEASRMIHDIRIEFEALQPLQAGKIPAAYLIWRKPYMTVGGDTFISNMMNAAGFRNVFADQIRYPVVEINDLRDSGCKVILLSSEPFPFKTKHQDELKTLIPDVNSILADGEMFSWYGSRLLKFPAYVKALHRHLVDKDSH
jgi:ABC-type Fe3+-hydroxamate transport system substrate-binding protein